MRRVFFSFDHSTDTHRAAVVREQWATPGEQEPAGFWNVPGEAAADKASEEVIRRAINSELKGTSVTVVLIGPWTASRRSVQYEVARSIRQGNGLLGIHVHAIKGQRGLTTLRGISPLPAECQVNGCTVSPRVYDWTADHGPENLGAWIEEAAQAVGK